MLVGLGGNNGTTVAGGILANKQYVACPAGCTPTAPSCMPYPQ